MSKFFRATDSEFGIPPWLYWLALVCYGVGLHFISNR